MNVGGNYKIITSFSAWRMDTSVHKYYPLRNKYNKTYTNRNPNVKYCYAAQGAQRREYDQPTVCGVLVQSLLNHIAS